MDGVTHFDPHPRAAAAAPEGGGCTLRGLYTATRESSQASLRSSASKLRITTAFRPSSSSVIDHFEPTPSASSAFERTHM